MSQFPDLRTPSEEIDRSRAIAAPQHRSGGPSDLSRQEASQPKALLTIADAAMLALIFLFVFALPALFGGL